MFSSAMYLLLHNNHGPLQTPLPHANAFFFLLLQTFTSSHCVQNVCFKFFATHFLHQCLKIYIVTTGLTLPDSQLQYFLHLSLGVNPSQGIYRRIGATFFNHCYKFIHSHSPNLLKSYAQS